jgi:hypothetical protein
MKVKTHIIPIGSNMTKNLYISNSVESVKKSLKKSFKMRDSINILNSIASTSDDQPTDTLLRNKYFHVAANTYGC